MTLISTKSTTSPAEPQIVTARDPRTFWRVGLALALPVGPLLVTFARAIMPYWTSQDDATIAANIAAHPKTMELMNWIGLPVLPFMLITVLGLGYVARRGAPVLAAVGTIPAFFAYAMWNSAGPSDYLGWVMSTHGYSVAQMVTLSNQLGDTAMATLVGRPHPRHGHRRHRAAPGSDTAAVGRDPARPVATAAPGRSDHRAQPMVGRLRRLGNDDSDLWLCRTPGAAYPQ